MKELKDLQVGDKVILHDSRRLSIKQVEKVTKNYLRVDGCLYRKDDGFLRGASSFWVYSFIEVATEERIKEVEETERRDRLTRDIMSAIKTNMPLEKLERIMKIVEE